MSYEDYVSVMIQKYRLAVAISVLKSKPSDLSIEQYIEKLKSKCNKNIEMEVVDLNVSICSDDFDEDVIEAIFDKNEPMAESQTILDDFFTENTTLNGKKDDNNSSFSQVVQVLRDIDENVYMETFEPSQNSQHYEDTQLFDYPTTNIFTGTKGTPASCKRVNNSQKVDLTCQKVDLTCQKVDLTCQTVDLTCKNNSDVCLTKEKTSHEAWLKSKESVQTALTSKKDNIDSSGNLNVLTTSTATKNDTYNNTDFLETQMTQNFTHISQSQIDEINIPYKHLFGNQKTTDKGKKVTDKGKKVANMGHLAEYDEIDEIRSTQDVSNDFDSQMLVDVNEESMIVGPEKQNISMVPKQSRMFLGPETSTQHKNNETALNHKENIQIITINSFLSLYKTDPSEILYIIDKNGRKYRLVHEPEQNKYQNIQEYRNKSDNIQQVGRIPQKCQNIQQDGYMFSQNTQQDEHMISQNTQDRQMISQNTQDRQMISQNTQDRYMISQNIQKDRQMISQNIQHDRQMISQNTQKDRQMISQKYQNRQEDNNLISQNTQENITVSQRTLPDRNISQDTQEISQETQCNNIDEEFSNSQVQAVSFKVLAEFNQIKTFLDKGDRRSAEQASQSDSGYKSDSQKWVINSSQQSVKWVNQSAHHIFSYLLDCQLTHSTEKITGEISQVLARLIDRLHDDEHYPPFLAAILESIDKMLTNLTDGEHYGEHVLVEKDETIQRLCLLNKSAHIIKYTIEKITQKLEIIHTNLTNTDKIYEAADINVCENSSYLFHLLETLLERYIEVKDVLTQESLNSQENETEKLLKKSSITDIWRKKWIPNYKENALNNSCMEKQCVLTKCSETLNKIIVDCMEGYSLVSFSALQCFNILQK